jgi:excisionase family DNA binding protein
LTLAEFASLVGISSTAAYELAQQNGLPVPVWRVGRQYRISKAAYEAMLTPHHRNERDGAT